MQKKYLIISSALALSLLLVVSVASVSAAANKNNSFQHGKGGAMSGGHGQYSISQHYNMMQDMEARQQAEEKALAANDYNAWLQAVGTSTPITKKINQTNFAQYVEIYNLRQQIKIKAQALGLDDVAGPGMGMMGRR